MEQSLVLEKHGFKQLLHVKPYLMYMMAQTISRFGDSVDSIAYSWMVYMLTGSELLMGSIYAFNFLPGLLFSMFTGVFVDRWNKRAVIIVTYCGRGLMVTATAILFAISALEVWHLFVFTFIISTLECFSRPAEMSLVPRLLPKDMLLAGNSFSSSVNRTAELIGISSAGALIALLGISAVMVLDAVMFVLSAAAVALIPYQEKETDRTSEKWAMSGSLLKNVADDMKEAFGFARKHHLLLITTSLAAFINFCVTPINVLQPVYVRESLNAGAGGMSILGTGLLVGMITAGVWLGQFGGKLKKSTLTISGTLMLGLGYGALGLAPYMPAAQLVFASFCMFMLGAAVTIASTPMSTYVMEVTPREMLGRIGSLVVVVCTAAIPLASFLTGLLAKHMLPQTFYLIMAPLLFMPVLLLLGNKKFRAI